MKQWFFYALAHYNICKVFLNDEMHQKGAKYSYFHLELIFI